MSTNNPLNRYPRLRQVLLDIQFVTAGAVAVLAAAFTATGIDFPSWFIAATAVLPALWAYLGFTAARNVEIPAEYDARDESPDLPVA